MIISPFLFSCGGDDVTDSKKTVELTIYPDTGFNGFLFSDDMYGEFLQFTEGKSSKKQLLLYPGESFNNFNYQKGYKYKLKATKITLNHAPQEGANTTYEYLETLSKEKVLDRDIESEITIEVAPVKINFMPIGKEPQSTYLTKATTEHTPRPITSIEGFDFEKGYTYRLLVKKIIQATPYKERYILSKIISKNK